MNTSFYKDVIQICPIAYAYHKIICDSKGTPCDYEFVEVNPAFENFTGLKKKDLIGKRVTRVIPGIENDSFDWIGEYGKIALNGGTREFDQFSEPLNKHYKIKAYSPQKNYFITLFFDISEELITREKHKQKEINFQLLFDNMKIAATIFDVVNDGRSGRDYIFKGFNKESVRLEGKTKQEIIGKSLFDIKPNIDKNIIDLFRKVWKTGVSGRLPAKYYDDIHIHQYNEYNVFQLSPNEIVVMYNDVTDIIMIQRDLVESRNKFKKYVDKAPYGIFVADENGNYTDVNEEACNITGYTKNELVGKNLITLIPDEDKEKAQLSFQGVKKYGQFDVDSKYINKNNEIREWNVRAIKLNDNSFLGFVADITEEKALERKVLKSEEEYRALFDNAGLGISYYTPAGTAIWYNKAAAKNMGGIPEDFKGKSVYELFPQKVADEHMARIDQVVKTNKPIEYIDEVELLQKKRWFKGTYNSILSSEKELLGVQIIAQDITELIQSQKSLAESEKRFRALFEDAPMGYQSLDKKGYVIDVNKAWLNTLGYTKKDVVGRFFGDFIVPEYADTFKKNFSRFIKTGSSAETYEMLTKDKEKVIISFNGKISYDKSGKFKQTHCILQNITEQRKAEIALLESEKKFRSIFDHAALGIGNISLDGHVLYANKKYCEILGYDLEKLKTMTFMDFTHPDDVQKSLDLFQKVKNGEAPSMQLEKKYIRKNGKAVDVFITASMVKDADGHPLYSVTTVHDITERKKLEENNRLMETHLQNQQKLESIGTLAGGVAHEINNPINGIMNYSQLILDSSDLDSDTAEYAKEIIQETNRVSTIVKNLLQFSRQEKQTYSKANIKDIIDQTLSLVKTIIKNDQIDFSVDVPEALPGIKCRSQQIQQVLMNLITNARDALNHKYAGGTTKIKS